MTWIFPTPNVTWAGRGYLPPGHLGVDFAPLPIGSPIVCTHGGTVIQANFEAGGFGNVVVVRHEDTDTGKGSWRSLYAHLDRIDVRAGDYIAQGALVGLSGNSGGSTGPHLHFQIMDGGGNNSQNTIDPMTVLTDPPPPPLPKEETVMLLRASDTGACYVWGGDEAPRGVGDPDQWNALVATTSPVHDLLQIQVDRIIAVYPKAVPPGNTPTVLNVTLTGTATGV